MRILYVANIRLPTEKAHGLQIMKTCEAFAEAGNEVELVVTSRFTPITEEPFAYYGIRKKFKLTRVHVPDTVRFGRIGFWFETFMFARACLRVLRGKPCDLLYGRDEMVLAHLGERTTTKIVWETHTGANNRCTRSLTQKGRIVAITQGLKDFYVAQGVPSPKIVIAPDGIDLQDFEKPEPRESARTRLGLPQMAHVILYIGRLDGWKGSETFLQLADLLPESVCAVIGGEPKQVKNLQRHFSRVMFLGYRPYKELPHNQAAADVLVLSNTGKDEISTRFTSPLKLFSYMASGIPIVTSNLPSIREVVSEEEVFFAKPDNARSFADAIVEVKKNPAEAKRRSSAARTRVEAYDWKNRAKTILDFLRLT